MKTANGSIWIIIKEIMRPYVQMIPDYVNFKTVFLIQKMQVF